METLLEQYKENLKEILLNEDILKMVFSDVRNDYISIINDKEKLNNYCINWLSKHIGYIEYTKDDKKTKEKILNNNISYCTPNGAINFIKALNRYSEEEESYLVDVINSEEYIKAVNEFVEGQELTQDYFIFLTEINGLFTEIIRGAYALLFKDKPEEEIEKQLKNNYVNKFNDELIKNDIDVNIETLLGISFLPGNEEISIYTLKLLKNLKKRKNSFLPGSTKRYKYKNKVWLYNDNLLNKYIEQEKLNYYDIYVLANIIEVFYYKKLAFTPEQLTKHLNNSKSNTGIANSIEDTKQAIQKLKDLNLLRINVNKDNFLEVKNVNILAKNRFELSKSTIIDKGINGKNKRIVRLYIISKCELFKMSNGKPQEIILKDVYKMLGHLGNAVYENRDREMVQELLIDYKKSYGYYCPTYKDKEDKEKVVVNKIANFRNKTAVTYVIMNKPGKDNY